MAMINFGIVISGRAGRVRLSAAGSMGAGEGTADFSVISIWVIKKSKYICVCLYVDVHVCGCWITDSTAL